MTWRHYDDQKCSFSKLDFTDQKTPDNVSLSKEWETTQYWTYRVIRVINSLGKLRSVCLTNNLLRQLSIVNWRNWLTKGIKTVRTGKVSGNPQFCWHNYVYKRMVKQMCTNEMLELFHCFVGNTPQNLSFKFIILFSISTKVCHAKHRNFAHKLNKWKWSLLSKSIASRHERTIWIIYKQF